MGRKSSRLTIVCVSTLARRVYSAPIKPSNNSNYGNDFAHVSTLPMTIGASIDDAKATRPLFIVATRTGCHDGDYARFDNPPVTYIEVGCKELKDSLDAADFKDGRLVVHRID